MKRKLALEILEEKKLLAADIGISDGALVIEGTSQDDTVVVSEASSLVTVRNGDETLTFSRNGFSRIEFRGHDGDDHFENNTSLLSTAYGGRGNDTLIGGSHNDELRGGPDNDTIIGNDGHDDLHGDYGNDVIDGGNGNDGLRGWYGDDVLIGGDGHDYVSGYLGDDDLFGGEGNDLLRGHEGDDLLDGGDGHDRLLGWRGDDVLIGGEGNDTLSGWSGDDILIGGDGHDSIRGHSGRDLIIGGQGNDRIDGGSGQDFIITGTTDFDEDHEALDNVMAKWDTNESVQQRTSNVAAFIESYVAVEDGGHDSVINSHDDLDLNVLDNRDRVQNS